MKISDAIANQPADIRLARFLEDQADDEVFLSADILSKTGIDTTAGSGFVRKRLRNYWLKTAPNAPLFWGNKKAISTLRKQLNASQGAS